EQEDTGRGGYQNVVTELPYQVKKSGLVEKIAELIQEKKLPLLGDMRDESAEHIRLVLEPRARTVDPVVLMESLFKLTELEIRFGLNMNVLTAGQIPAVLGLKEVMQHWLEHRQEVLIRRTEHRLAKIAHRLEVLAGFLIAFLNIDEVIRIVRFEDQPKAKLMSTFGLSDVQAEAILNLRLRSLSKLEEQEIRAEHDKLSGEQRDLQSLIDSEDRQWETISTEIRDIRERWGKKTELGRRRSVAEVAPDVEIDLEQMLIEKEPVTIVFSEKGWVRSLKGHQDDLAKLEFKQGDSLKRAIKASTTDKLLVFATNGKFYTLEASQLPGGRGQGEPLRLMVDIEETADFVEMMVHQPGRKLIVAATSGHGFVVPEDEVVASTRKGKQVLNVEAPYEARICVPVSGDHVATVGDNRKMLVFTLAEVNEMARGKGVYLQRFKDGSLSDVRVFAKAQGLTWVDGAGRTHTRSWSDLAEWVGERAQAGRAVPKGFPQSGKFGPAF
ncbi:MAG: DNA gyrase subunit A, partial [Hyphomicrobiaceae bacterium]